MIKEGFGSKKFYVSQIYSIKAYINQRLYQLPDSEHLHTRINPLINWLLKQFDFTVIFESEALKLPGHHINPLCYLGHCFLALMRLTLVIQAMNFVSARIRIKSIGG